MSEWGAGAFRVGEVYYYLGGSNLARIANYVEGDLCEVAGDHPMLPYTWFIGMPFNLKSTHPWFFTPLPRANFRPAAPEEIAAHLEKKDMAPKPVIPEDADMNGTSECSYKEECSPASDEGQTKEKITFTVSGREFFVGQTVYANTIGYDGNKKLRNVPHEVTGCIAEAALVCIRETEGFKQRIISSSCLSESPLHEWKFGDQAQHPDHGKVIVIQITKSEGFICASPSDPDIFIDPSELTFNRRTDLGE